MPSEARQKKIMEKLNRAQKCSILGPQNLGSRGGPGPPGPPPWIRTWVFHHKKDAHTEFWQCIIVRYQYLAKIQVPIKTPSDVQRIRETYKRHHAWISLMSSENQGELNIQSRMK